MITSTGLVDTASCFGAKIQIYSLYIVSPFKACHWHIRHCHTKNNSGVCPTYDIQGDVVIDGRRLSEVDATGVRAGVEPANGVDAQDCRPLRHPKVSTVTEGRGLRPQVGTLRIHLQQTVQKSYISQTLDKTFPSTL